MRHCSDLHIHTLASHHAYSTLLENVTYAQKAGLSLIAITDHAYGAPDSGNTWHFGNQVVWPRVMEGVTVLRGAEVNIMDMDGRIDMTQGDLECLDYAIVSLHPYCVKPAGRDAHLHALMAALENPLLHTIGHPADVHFELDFDALARFAAKKGKRVEINEHAMRFDAVFEMNVSLLAACRKYQCPVVLSTDAHVCFEVGRYPKTDQLLKEADFPEELIWNRDAAHVLNALNISQ